MILIKRQNRRFVAYFVIYKSKSKSCSGLGFENGVKRRSFTFKKRKSWIHEGTGMAIDQKWPHFGTWQDVSLITMPQHYPISTDVLWSYHFTLLYYMNGTRGTNNENLSILKRYSLKDWLIDWVWKSKIPFSKTFNLQSSDQNTCLADTSQFNVKLLFSASAVDSSFNGRDKSKIVCLGNAFFM